MRRVEPIHKYERRANTFVIHMGEFLRLDLFRRFSIEIGRERVARDGRDIREAPIFEFVMG